MAAQGFNNTHGFDNGPAPPAFGFRGGYGAYNPYYPPPGYYPHPQFMPQQMIPMQQYQMSPPGAAAVAPFPGMILKNETGGGGYPGYYYLYPQEHCKIHVFNTKEKPWQTTNPLWNYDATNHVKLVVPTTMTIKELMQNLGLKNGDANKNVLYELTEKGNGRWTTGIKLAGGDKDKVKKTIADWGWTKSRTGHPGQLPVVWIWVTDQGV